MPTSVNVNGKTIYVPGIYGYVDASALAGKGISTGNVAVVGDFPTFQQNAINWFTSPQAIREWDSTDLVLSRVAKLLFSPASDDAISGANKVLLVNAGTVTQAKYTFKDADAVDSVVFKSKKWGIKGNQIYVEMKPTVADPKLLNVNVSYAGQTESYFSVGSGDIAEFDLNTAICTEMANAASTSTVSVKAGSPQKLTWAFSNVLGGAVAANVPNPAADTTVTWANMVVTGKVTAVLSAVAPAGCTITITCNGKSLTGANQTATAVFSPGEGLVAKTPQVGGGDAEWTEITSVVLSSAGNNPTAATTVTVAGNAFDLTLSSFSKVSDLVAAVNNYSAKGWIGSSLLPSTAQVPATKLDKLLNQSVIGASTAKFRADLWALVQTLASSNNVIVEEASGAVKAPHPWNVVGGVAAQTLLGGTQTSPNSTAYENALAEVETQDIQWVVALDTSIAVLKAVRQHCINSAIVGRERAAFGGAPANTSLSNLLTQYTAQLNSRHISLCGQEISVTSVTGAAEWLGPEYMAVQLAGMKAGSGVAEPLTNKKPDVLDFRGSWTPIKNDNEVIEKGIIAYTSGQLGVKVLRSITTWLTDDNPAYSELSANESVNANIRSLRANLESSIGTKADLPLAVFKAKIESLLTQQITDGIIYAWRNVVIEKIADKYRIDYDVAPIFPFNFAEIWAHVGDFEF